MVVDPDAGFSASVLSLVEDAGYQSLSAATGEEALCLVRTEALDIAVLAVELPGISGYEVCRRFREERGAMGIVLVSDTRTEPLDRAAGFLIGADYYLPKPFTPDELLGRIRALLRRGAAQIPASAAVPAARNGLTAREREVLALLARGAVQGEIAQELVISPKTVAAHIDHILRKLDVHSRAQAVAVAYRDGYLA